MSFDYVRRCLMPDLPVAGLPHLVLIILASHANAQGVAWRAVPRMAAQARCSDRRIQSSLRQLERAGLIAVRRNDGPHGCNVFQLTLPPMPAEGDHSVTPLKRRPRGRAAFSVEQRGDASVTGGDHSVTLTPASPVVTPTSQGGDLCVADGATPASPEASGSLKEADSTASAAADQHEQGDDSSEARWAAVVAAYEAGDGPWITFKGQDLKPEWLRVTHGEAASTVRVNLAQWRPSLPSSYAKRRAADAETAADRSKRSTDEVRQSAAIAEAAAERALAVITDDDLRPVLPRLINWIKGGTPPARAVSSAIAYERTMRYALDLCRAGKPYGVRQLLKLLTPPERRHFVAALLDLTRSDGTAAAEA